MQGSEVRDGIVEAAREAAALIAAEAPAIEAGRRLTAPVLTTLRDTGVFRMAMSTSMGGPERPLLAQVEVIEELSAADASVGWCAMIGSDGGYFASYLDPTAAAGMFPNLDMTIAAVVFPSGRARVEDGGYRVEGRWAFASGAPHADWFFLNCVVVDGDGPVLTPAGQLETRMVALAPEQVRILDTWDTSGLVGTASHDVEVAAHVPFERTFNLFDASGSSPLCRWPFTFALKALGVPLGVARAAIDDALEVASTKVTMPAMTLVRDAQDVQDTIGRSRAAVGSARAYAFDALGTFWDEVSQGDDPSPATIADVRLAMTNAMQTSKGVVSRLYEALGTTGVYRRSTLERRLRDVTVMAQHRMWQTGTYAAAGRRALGLDPAYLGF